MSVLNSQYDFFGIYKAMVIPLLSLSSSVSWSLLCMEYVLLNKNIGKKRTKSSQFYKQAEAFIVCEVPEANWISTCFYIIIVTNIHLSTKSFRNKGKQKIFVAKIIIYNLSGKIRGIEFKLSIPKTSSSINQIF